MSNNIVRDHRLDPWKAPIRKGGEDGAALEQECNTRWIVDGCQRSLHVKLETLLMEYRETPTKTRKLTVSLDYRNAHFGSLEADVASVENERDI